MFMYPLDTFHHSTQEKYKSYFYALTFAVSHSSSQRHSTWTEQIHLFTHKIQVYVRILLFIFVCAHAACFQIICWTFNSRYSQRCPACPSCRCPIHFYHIYILTFFISSTFKCLHMYVCINLCTLIYYMHKYLSSLSPRKFSNLAWRTFANVYILCLSLGAYLEHTFTSSTQLLRIFTILLWVFFAFRKKARVEMCQKSAL